MATRATTSPADLDGTVNWGDGTPVADVTINGGHGLFDVRASVNGPQAQRIINLAEWRAHLLDRLNRSASPSLVHRGRGARTAYG